MADFLMLASETGTGWRLLAWAFGFTVSLGFGSIVTDISINAGNKRVKKSIEDDVSLSVEERSDLLRDFERKGSVPGWITGIIERIFFTTAAAIEPAVAIPAMLAWLGIKLAANWQRTPSTGYNRSRTFLAAAVGLMAMWFALMGGLICRVDFQSFFKHFHSYAF